MLNVPAETKSVLVWSDKRHIVRLIQVNLERQGCRVATTFTGSAALTELAKAHYELVVVDEKLPDMTGQELQSLIQERPELGHVRVLLLTSSRDRGDGDPPRRPGSLKLPAVVRKVFGKQTRLS